MRLMRATRAAQPEMRDVRREEFGTGGSLPEKIPPIFSVAHHERAPFPRREVTDAIPLCSVL